jgi:hypothetical protein
MAFGRQGNNWGKAWNGIGWAGGEAANKSGG